MKKILILLFIYCLFTSNYTPAIEDSGELTTSQIDVIVSEDGKKFGLKDKDGNVIIEPQYKKLIRLGQGSWIIQKGSKFGLIDCAGNELVKPKYRHVERVFGKYVKLGNDNDYGLYNEYGEIVIVPEYQRIDPLFGEMFLTFKNYKYGVVDKNGKVILENEYDDIYMPNKDTMRIKYQGEWFEVQRAQSNISDIAQESKKINVAGNELTITRIITDTGLISGYSALTAADYLLKLFTSISPAYEQTIDELMLSQGAETVSIFMKLGWLPKFPFTYAKKYYQNVRHPATGPLSDIREDVKRQIGN